MPEITRFFGIIIRMFEETGERHHTPHFHAYYQDDVIIYSIDPVDVIAGKLPKRQQRLVEAWAEIHKQDLLANWDLLVTGQPINRLPPLQ